MHPRDVLLEAKGASNVLPACDHYCGAESRMRKSLQLQADMTEEFGVCVFDVTLDCEDGAPVGGEAEHAEMVAALAVDAQRRSVVATVASNLRLGVRLHPVAHPAFEADVQTIVGRAAAALHYVTVPKVESYADVCTAIAAVDAMAIGRDAPLPLHVLIESPAAVQQAFAIAAHPRVQSLSFGLMDFVSAHGGAIPEAAMSLRSNGDTSTLDQFHHPLVVRAKLEVASACHAHGKVPSHCVVTEYQNNEVLGRAARMANQLYGYTRMWSIHPAQIRTIIQAFSPSQQSCEMATEVLLEAQRQHWAPIALRGKLHDRASYRYFWHVLEQAHRTGLELDARAKGFFADAALQG